MLYDLEADVLYLHFMDRAVEGPLRQETVILELDEKERIMGIEIWDASKRGVWRSS